MIGRAAARLGKDAAEIALRFLADGMNLDDAVRAGAKLMDEPLSDAAEMMLKQNKRARERFEQSDLGDFIMPYVRSPEEVQGVANQFYSPRTFRNFARDNQRSLSNSAKRMSFSPREDRRNVVNNMRFSGDEVSAANGYAIQQLLLDASGGDPDVAAAIAQRLGYGLSRLL